MYTLRGRTIATTVEVEVLDVAGARVGGDNGTSRVALTLHRGAADADDDDAVDGDSDGDGADDDGVSEAELYGGVALGSAYDGMPLFGETEIVSADGVASFSLGVNVSAYGARLHAQAASLVGALAGPLLSTASAPFDVVALKEPVALALVDPPSEAFVLGVSLPPTQVHVVDATATRVLEHPTYLVYLCLRGAAADKPGAAAIAPCAPGSARLLGSASAFPVGATLPGGKVSAGRLAAFPSVVLSSAVIDAAGGATAASASKPSPPGCSRREWRRRFGSCLRASRCAWRSCRRTGILPRGSTASSCPRCPRWSRSTLSASPCPPLTRR